MIKDIRHTGIVVPNLVDALKFYKLLGFEECARGTVTAYEAFILYGSAIEIPYVKVYVFDIDRSHTIELYEMKGEDGYQGFGHISFTVEDIKKAWRFFSKKGLLLSSKIVVRDRHRLFFATDPWLNMLEIVEPPK